MTALVHIEPGHWVLTFGQPFGPHDRGLSEHLEMFTSRGGGWESMRAAEIFLIHPVQRLAPKTYWTDDALRFPRENVIAAGQSEAAVTALRDKFFAIGAEADDAIEFVVERLARPVRKRIRKKALAEIHKTFPHIFGRQP